MGKKIIFITIIILIIGGFIWFWLVNEKKQVESSKEEYSVPTHEEAELAGFNFILDFIKIAPPQSNSEAEERIYQALSGRAKEHVSLQTLVNDLAAFIGVQDAPDQGTSVEDLQIHDQSSATLIIGLNYSGGKIVRHIHLVTENGEWKVDRVSAPEQKTSFNQTGNLVRDNPGMEEGAWYLIYDEPGAPGKFVKLFFEGSSICGGVLCQDILTEQIKGSRIEIEGKKVDDQVEVSRLIFSSIEEKLRFIARSWIVKNSPTFLFDGMNLQFIETRGLDLVDCENCYEVDFSFESRHSGYGNREGEVLAQVITPHNITILIEESSVKRAVTDGVFDEMKGKFVDG